jgi:23S rRNA pseudouridine1911/1915/1917 synthase
MPDAAITVASATAPGTRDLRVPDGAASQRVDRFVADVTGISRSHVQKLISAGNLTSDGVALKANQVVVAGTPLRLVVPEPEPLDLAPAPEIDLEVVYEDADLLIVNKPAGLVVHPAPGHSDDTLVNALLARGGPESFGGIAGVRRPGIVHRLDRDTSGLLMVARTDAAQHSLMAQLKARRVKKPSCSGRSRPRSAGSRRRSGATRSTGPGWA